LRLIATGQEFMKMEEIVNSKILTIVLAVIPLSAWALSIPAAAQDTEASKPKHH
jgi:hypothetical protein